MIIANPIYDVVFKYLLDDVEIARELLSAILGVKVKSLAMKPKETIVQETSGEIRIYHVDFKAVIDQANGEEKIVLIELQKAKKEHDIIRFRKYLGENYSKEEVRVMEDGVSVLVALELVTIYILGFPLTGLDVPVLKVERKYINAATQTEVETNHEFIKKLTHESYVIQVSRLNKGHRNELEDILEVFSQENFVHNKQQIDFQKSLDNPLVNKMVKRLSKAAADEDVRRTMEGEDHLDRLLSQQSSEEKAEYEAQLKEKDLIIETVEKQLEVERAAKADTENQNAILLAKIKAMEDAELKRHAKE